MAKVLFVISDGDVTYEARSFGADYVLRVDYCEFFIAADRELRTGTINDACDVTLAVLEAAISCGTVDRQPARTVYQPSDKWIGLVLPVRMVEHSLLLAGIYGAAVKQDLYILNSDAITSESDAA
jgi:hypothetical protein